MEETRSHDQEEERLARLLGRLPTAEAPENFEAMVRSRIADHRPSESSSQPIFWLAMKFALPMLLLFAFGAFLIVSDESSLNAGMIPPVDSLASGSVDVPETEPSKDELTANSRIESARTPQVNRNASQPKTDPPSQVRTLEQDKSTLFPPGVDPRRIAGKVAAPTVLRMLGIESACSGIGCKVVSIQANSIADKFGVEQGDIVEAIDDKRISAGSTVEGSVSSLRIARAGKRSTVVLRPR